MQAIELNTQIQADGLICLPDLYKNWFGKKAKLILLESEVAEANELIFQTMADEIASAFSEVNKNEVEALLKPSESEETANNAYAIFSQLDLGEGDETLVSSAQAKHGIKAILAQKVKL